MRLSKSYVVRRQEHTALPVNQSPRCSMTGDVEQRDIEDQEMLLLPQVSSAGSTTTDENRRAPNNRRNGVRSETF